MKASCSYIVTALVHRCSLAKGARIRPERPPSYCPARWSSSGADHPIEARNNDALGFIQRDGNATELALSGKGKARDLGLSPYDRRNMIQETALALQRDIEESEEWRKANARYPGLKTKQISLVALLNDVIQKHNKAKSRLSPGEVLIIHSSILKADREAQSKAEMEKRFQPSSVAYMIMLKYAHRLRDSKYLKIIAKEAIIWKHTQGRDKLLDRKRNRFLHPRVAAASELSRLCRNLFVSMSIYQKVKISNGTESVLPGIQLPTSAPTVRRGDDAMTISRMLRQRVGGIKMATKEGKDGGEEKSLRFKKDAQSSNYPLTHQSRRIRWINRMIERGRLNEIIKMTASTSDSTTSSPESASKSQTITDTSSITSPSTSLSMPNSTTSEEGMAVVSHSEILEILSSAQNENQVRNRHLQALMKSYEKWQAELSRRLTSRKTLIQILRQFQLNSEVIDSNTIEAIRSLVPTWLVLTFLRLQIESGEPKRAEKMVELYLKNLSKIHQRISLKDVIPIDQHRVHSVTSPLIPPDGSSLLNGILRAHLTGGAGDCFERMIQVMDKWTVEGQGFSNAVLLKNSPALKEMKKGDESLLRSCLVPNDQTVLLLLQSLRSRKQSKIWGIRLVEEMWTRWGIVEFRDERQNIIEPHKHQSLKLPLQAMSTLLKWVTTETNRRKRKDFIFKVLKMEREWRAKAFHNNKVWLGATIEAKIAWDQIKEKANASIKLESRGKETFEGRNRNQDVQEDNKVEDSTVAPLYFTSSNTNMRS